MTPTDDERDLAKRFRTDYISLLRSGRSVVLPPMHPESAWALFCGLQLALRHPDNNGPLSKIQRQITEQLEAYLTEGYPALAEVARRGWTE